MKIDPIKIASIDCVDLTERDKHAIEWIKKYVRPIYLDQILEEHLYSIDLDESLDRERFIPKSVKEFLFEIALQDLEYAYVRFTSIPENNIKS